MSDHHAFASLRRAWAGSGQSFARAVCPARAAPVAVFGHLAKQPESGGATDSPEGLTGHLPAEYPKEFAAAVRNVRDPLQEYAARERGAERGQDPA
ncbi:hypothetical protein [Streptomyces sp. OR43]|uniref:hypothetical protein n=1 Tax=Streptomyces sp. or43 TaxID=2478957 RepID=UPI0011CD6456|nr:hypothetical protein [Streptomyces sp. or43]TXS41766.1 hypothetical protein EAO72_16425 [Streptomyces sp. or43]